MPPTLLTKMSTSPSSPVAESRNCSTDAPSLHVGIAHAAANLHTALRTNFPTDTFWLYPGDRAARVARRFFNSAGESGAAPKPPGALKRFAKRAVGAVANFGFAAHFQTAARLGRFDLYHEPNFVPFRTGLPLVVTVFAPSWPVAVLGFTIIGGGVAVVAPLSFSAAARIAGSDESDPALRHARVDAVIGRFNQFNYAGSLLGAVMTGLAELRVKESDRLAAIARGLAACGVEVEEGQDSLSVMGKGGRPAGAARIETALDHRIAMAFLVLGMGAAAPVAIDDGSPIDTSFPGFAQLMNGLGARIAAL